MLAVGLKQTLLKKANKIAKEKIGIAKWHIIKKEEVH